MLTSDQQAAALLARRGGELCAIDRFGEACNCFRLALSVAPSSVAILAEYGSILLSHQRHREAATVLRRHALLDPENASAQYNLASALHAAGTMPQAAKFYRRAIVLRPDHANAHYNFANALRQVGALERSARHYARAVALDPTHIAARANLGGTYQALGWLEKALQAYHAVLAHSPDDARVRFNAAQIRLVQGKLAKGFKEYEWGWRVPAGGRGDVRRVPQPLWEGEALKGRTVLLWAEQGLGDSLQFLRYAPLVAARGGRVMLEVQPEIVTLAARLPGVASTMALGAPLPSFDLHTPLLNLPRIFGTSLRTIPATPYLKADAERVAAFDRRLDELSQGKFKVGLVWAGNPSHSGDRWRSIAPKTLRPLFDLRGVHFFLLQKGAGRAGIEGVAMPAHVTDMGPQIADWDDTAAILTGLDLLVSVDTAPVHLAGALGRPAWVLLPAVPDWRWLLDRADSPWYPTLQLFRQASLGDWMPVIDRVAHALAHLAATRRTC